MPHHCFITASSLALFDLFFSYYWLYFCISILLQPDVTFKDTLVSVRLYLSFVLVVVVVCWWTDASWLIKMCMIDMNLSERRLNIQSPKSYLYFCVQGLLHQQQLHVQSFIPWDTVTTFSSTETIQRHNLIAIIFYLIHVAANRKWLSCVSLACWGQ